MPQGQPTTVPDDGLTTRQRRTLPVLAVHLGGEAVRLDELAADSMTGMIRTIQREAA